VKRHRSKPNSPRQPSQAAAVKADRPTTVPVPGSRPSAAKLWLFRLAALLLVPLVLLGAAELMLRLAGYGYPTGFFRHEKIGDTDWLVANDEFGRRFFPSGLARIPTPTVLRETKPPGTYRIFVFGESAALGDPRPAFGAPRYLEAILNERYPGTKFEVIRVAMTAINSYSLVEMAKECARLQGDLWIVYMGNNEMVGPYGAATVFGAQAPPRFLVKLSLAAQRLRLGQLLADLGEKLRAKPKSSWGGMEMFQQNRVPPGDKRKQVVYNSFQANLAEIVDSGLASGAKVLLSSVAVNLRDCPPFASVSRTNRSAQEQAAFQQALHDTSVSLTNNNFGGAANCLQAAVKLDPSSADLEFKLAENLSKSGALPRAREHYHQALENDALPFRADAEINRLISGAARARGVESNQNLAYVDAADWFAKLSPGEVPGSEWFFEHVHFNFEGNYQLALAWAKASEPWLPVARNASTAAEWPTQQICDQRLGLTDWNRTGVMQDVVQRLGRPPFVGQAGDVERIAAVQAEISRLKSGMGTNGAQAARVIYHDALQRAEGDHELHENYAEFLEAVGDSTGAAQEWQRVTELQPYYYLGYLNLGQLLGEQRKYPEARRALEKALELRPDNEEGWLELGKLDIAEEHFDRALSEFARAEALQPQDPRIYYQRGRALSKMARRSEAIAEFRKALDLSPSFWQARFHLAQELAQAGENDAALKEFQEVVRINPENVLSQLNFGVALFKAGRLEEARQHFLEAQRLDPQDQNAANFLKRLEQMPRRIETPR
jgi:tetratricopeptide (TPR) repeat protein